MNDDLDKIREILGDDLFYELDSSDDMIEDPWALLDAEEIDHIANGNYQMMLPFTGESAMQLISSAMHSLSTGCEECGQFVDEFTGTMLRSMWVALVESVPEDGDADDLG